MAFKTTGLPLIIVAAISFSLYWGILDQFFLNDDFGRLLALWPLQKESIAYALESLFQFSYHGLYYRPLTNIVFYLLGKLVGLAPMGYYVSSILLHIGASMAAFALLKKLLERNLEFLWLPLSGALLFVSHPRHVESVSYIHDNENVICGLFFFLGFYFFIRYWQEIKIQYLWYAGGCYLMSLLGKEMGITLPLIWVLYALFWPRENKWGAVKGKKTALKISFVIGVVLGLYFLLRVNGLGQWVGGAGETSRLEFDLIRMARTLLQAGVAMIVPNDFIGLAQAASFFRNHPVGFIIAFFCTAVALLYFFPFYKSRNFLFGSFFIVITMIPVLNNGISVEHLTGGRYLYISILGFVLIVVDILRRISHRNLRACLIVFLLLGQSAYVVRNNRLISVAADISERYLRGLGELAMQGGNEQHVLLLPSFYRGLYLMQSSLRPSLELCYGEHGRDLYKRLQFIISLNLMDDKDIGIDVTREGGEFVIECTGQMGVLWKDEFYGSTAKESYNLKFEEVQLVNSRGDFMAKRMRIANVVSSFISPDFAGTLDAKIKRHHF